MDFRPAKKKVGIYFNDGDGQTAVQGEAGVLDAAFINAVKKAKAVFFEEYRKTFQASAEQGKPE